MDGRPFRNVYPLILAGAAALAAGLFSAGAHAEAMGKSALELPSIGPTVVAATPAVTGPGSVTPKETPRVPAPIATAATAEPTTPTPATPAAGGTVSTPKAASTETVAPAAETNVEPVPPATKPAEVIAGTSIEQNPIRPPSDEPKNDNAAAPKSNATSGLYSTLQVGGALAIVIGLILIGRALMRKFVPGAKVGAGKGVIETLARYPIGRNQSVVLLRIGSQIVALNQTKDSSQSILVINEPLEVAKIIGQIEGRDPTSIQANFNRVLSNARMDLESPDTMDVLDANRAVTDNGEEDLDQQLEEMAAAKRQLMELRAQVRSVRDNLPA